MTSLGTPAQLRHLGPDGDPGSDAWEYAHSGNSEGYTFYRVPLGRVQVTALIDREHVIEVGEVEIRQGERTVIAIDPDAVPTVGTGR